MNSNILLVLAIAAIFLLNGGQNRKNINNANNNRNNENNRPNYKNISPQEARKKLEFDSDVILVDVRTLEEYNEGHIPKSILLPVDFIEEKAYIILPDRTRPIIVYCKSGNRATLAAEKLAKLGYIEVYNMGGILDWPYEIVREVG